MTDRRTSSQNESQDPWDDFEDVESQMGWSRENTRSLTLLLVGFGILVALVSLGSLFG